MDRGLPTWTSLGHRRTCAIDPGKQSGNHLAADAFGSQSQRANRLPMTPTIRPALRPDLRRRTRTSRPIALVPVAAALLLCVHASSRVSAFMVHSQSCRAQPRYAQAHDDSIDAVAQQFQDMSVADIQQTLVQKGLQFADDPCDQPLQKVPGCVADVRVRAIATGQTIAVTGTADALISRGLLAVVARWMEMTTLSQILAQDAATLAQQLGISAALSPGRNDGIASMVRVLQDQIRQDAVAPLHDAANPAERSEATSDRPKVALLLSGGVDSSVALRLLLRDGYDVTPFYLKIWLEDELAHLGECPWEEDVKVCHAVCGQAGIGLVTLSLQAEYKKRVMDHTIQEAAQGRTPNPDILCNSRVKFGCFLETLTQNPDVYGSFDYIASGHYAQLQHDATTGTQQLFRAPDPVKDQSYFLCTLRQDQLAKVKFPIGHLEKSKVRELADEFELPNRHRPDSQGLCFLGKLKFSDFLEANLGVQPGLILDAFTNETIGQHNGVWYHTVGQRKGIGNSLHPLATSRGPWYVVAKDPKHNIVYASNQYDEEAFTQARSKFQVEDVHWIDGGPPQQHRIHPAENDTSSGDADNFITSTTVEPSTYRFAMKIRHGPRLVSGSVQWDAFQDTATIELDHKDGGLAPGQYVVFYDPETAQCFGSGIISERHWARFLQTFQQRDEEAVPQ